MPPSSLLCNLHASFSGLILSPRIALNLKVWSYKVKTEVMSLFTKVKIKLLEVDGITKNRGNREEMEVVLGEVFRIRFADKVGKIKGGTVRGTGRESGEKGSGKLSFLESRKEE